MHAGLLGDVWDVQEGNVLGEVLADERCHGERDEEADSASFKWVSGVCVCVFAGLEVVKQEQALSSEGGVLSF